MAGYWPGFVCLFCFVFCLFICLPVYLRVYGPNPQSRTLPIMDSAILTSRLVNNHTYYMASSASGQDISNPAL